jgi:uncharacterized repeat protein (TIGR01451 family)
MSKFVARLLPLAMLLAGPFVLGAADTARAQVAQVAVSKDICGLAVAGGGCVIGSGALPVVAPNTQVSYQITLQNPTGQNQTVDLGETFAAGFNLDPSFPPTCNNSPIQTPSSVPPLTLVFFSGVTVPPMGQTICTITGYFNYLPATVNNANNTVAVYPTGDRDRTHAVVSGPVNAVVGSPATIPSDVSVVKTAQVTAQSNGTATVTYTITVTNNGPNDVYGLQLQDRVSLPSTSIPLTVTYTGSYPCAVLIGSGTSPGTTDCFDPVPVPSTNHSPAPVPSTSPVDFVEWGYLTGSNRLLRAGDSMVIKFDAVITVPTGTACQSDPNGNALINTAHIGFNIPGATTTIFESAPGNNTSPVSVPITFNAAVDPNCGKPALQITKKLLPPQTAGTTFAWGTTLTYEVTLQNLSTLPLTNLNIQLNDTPKSLGDFVSGGIGTPAFTAQVVGITCPFPATPALVCANTAQAGPVLVAGYLQPYWTAGTDVTATLQPAGNPGASVSFQLQIQYTNPECDSYPDITQKLVRNVIRASYIDPTLAGATITLQTAPAIALFDRPAKCDFKVTKAVTDGSQKIVFGQDVHYTVTYQNQGAQVTTGTLIDTLRIKPPAINQPDYAWPLNVQYSYTCTGSPGVTGYPVTNSLSPLTNSVQVVPTALPQQGVRIIQNLVPVFFPANSTVTCNVTVNVAKPLPGNAHCARVGELENTAVMDKSQFYDPNWDWGNTPPSFAASAPLPLPQCFNLVVNKSVKPIWTTQNGGPLTYQLIVSNVGDPIVPTDGVSVTDAFVPVPLWNYVGSLLVNQCLNSSTFFPAPHLPECDYTWSTPPTSITSTLNIQSLAHNWSAAPTFQVNGPYPDPYPATPGQVCNDAVVTLLAPPTGLKPEDWYQKDPATWQTRRCAPIFTASDLKVIKVVQAVAPALPPPPTSFTVTVNCSLIVGGTNYAPSQTFTFNTPPDPIPSQTMSNIPVGSTCTIAEQALPTTPIPNKGCPSGLAVWNPVQYPDVLDPKQPRQSLLIGASANALEALNTFACVPVKTNIKICKVAGPGVAVGTPFTFTVGSSTVTVPAGPAPGGTCVLGPSVAVGSTVTVSETMAGATVTSIAVTPTSRLVGTPNLAGGSVNIAIGSGMTDVTFTNQRLGFLEICKSGDVTGSFNFTVNPGGLGPFAVPVGACTPAIQVNAGPVVIQEAPTSGISMTGCATVPANQQGACNLGAGTSTVTVAPGDVSSATVALITNRRTADLTVRKTIVAPPGGTLPNLGGVMFPVNVVCTPFGPSTSVTLSAANPSQVIPNIPLGSTCNVVELPLAGIGTCGKPLVSVALPPTYVPGQNVTITAPPASASVEVINVLGCIKMGALSIIKTMGPTGAAATPMPIGAAPTPIPPGVTFPVQVSCTPNGPNQTVNLTAATPNVTLSNITPGSICTITELAPVGPIPSNCNWGQTTYPSGQSATIPAQPTVERIVQNALICKPVLAPVTLLKTITNLVPGMATPNTAFPVAITCQPGGAVVNVALLPNTPQTVNLPVGSSCNVAEVTPLPSLSGTCVPGAAVPPIWLPPTYLPGQPVTIPAPPAAPLVVTVNNVMACSPMGSLRVEKKMAPGPAVVPIPPGVTFPVQVSCTPGGPNQTVNLTAATPSVTLPNIAAGRVCTLTELTPIGTIPSNCKWGAATYPIGQTATIPPVGTIERFVQNALVCIPAAGLTVKKTVSAPPGGSLPDLTGVTFPVNVDCTPSGPSTTLNLTAANPSQVVPNIAPGSVCKVAEQPLTVAGKCNKPLVAVALPPTYQPGQSVTIAAPPATSGVEVANLMGCVPAGSLNVGKQMAPIPGAPSPIPPGITFPVQVTCTPAGPNQIVNLTAAMPNVTLTGIAATSACTLTELAPIGPIPSKCEWAKPTYPIGQTATIPAGSTIEKFVLNQLVCK